MVSITLFMLLVLVAVISMLLITLKVQRGLRSMNYVSGVRYGKVVQQLQDKHELHRFGFGQYFRRQYGELSIFSIAMNGMGIFPMMLLLLAPVVQQVGLGASLFVFCGVGFFFLIIIALVSQYLSAQPTAGGLYHVALLKGGNLLGSIVGGLQLMGQLLLLLGYSFGVVFFISLLVPQYSEWLTSPLGLGVAMAICLATQALTTLLKSTSYRFLYIIMWLLQLIGIVLLLIFVLRGWSSSSYNGFHLFMADASVEGWFPAWHEAEPLHWGMLFALIGRFFIGADTSAQHAEETIEPKVKVAWSTMLSSCYSYMLGIVLLLMLALLYMNLSYSGATESGGLWVTQLLGEHGWLGYAIVVAGLLSCWSSSVTLLQSSSRTLLAMARDSIVPFQNSLSMMHYIKQVPQRAIIVTVVLAILLLIGLGSIAVEQLLLHATLLAVLSYCCMYVLILFFIPLRGDGSIWKVEGWEAPIRMIGMLLLTCLASAAGACLPLGILLIGIIPVMLLAIYVLLRKGWSSKLLVYDQSGGRDLFDMEKNLPIQ